jgi:hypothetical protein
MTRNLLVAVLTVLPALARAGSAPAPADGSSGPQILSKSDEGPGQVEVSQAVFEPGPSPRGIVGNGGWLFADSPDVATTLQPVVISRLSYASVSSPSRPFGSNIGDPGAAVELGGELGLVAGLALEATAIRGSSFLDQTGATGGQAGLRVSVLPSSTEHWRLVLSGGWLYELTGDNGAWMTVQGGFEAGPIHSQLSVHAEHIFAPGRDPVDIMITAGIGVRVLSFMRLGVEYVGQDLEAVLDGDSDAEGGARHLLGPTVAFNFVDNKLSVVAGPALAMGATNIQVVGRLAVSYGF